MKWGICALLLIIILIVSIIIYICTIKINFQENFLALDETKLYNLYKNPNLNPNLNPNPNPNPNLNPNPNPNSLITPTTANDNKPVDIEYQIPVPVNQLSDEQLQSIDSDVLRNIRTLANFSMTDELNFYQIYSIIKNIKNTKYNFEYKIVSDDKKNSVLESEKLIAINSGAINTTDLELFTRLKLELISAFNALMIKNDAYISYHPYQFFKIINSNMISNKIINNNSKNNSNNNSYNFIFTLTFAREYKYQQFVIYYDVVLNPKPTNDDITVSDSINYEINLNKVELIGIPIPKTIEFHSNQKTTSKDNEIDMNTSAVKNTEIDFYYEDQVSDNSTIDVTGSSEISSRFNNPNLKYIDITEISDMDNTMFDENSQSAKIESRRMNVARDQQFNNHKCYGLVNGISQELPQYKNPIFCKSFHPEINQNGIWDSPCQVNSDCPFYKANKNYSNEFGKCDKITGQCEMPMGIIPIGFTKYGKIEPNCYNCGATTLDSKCCESQSNLVKSGVVNYKSPDYVFTGDESYRKQFETELKSIGLLVNPSI